jgi:cytochrome oxidase assembly protein ShyY1
MTIPDYILGAMFAAILALQSWQLSSIVNIKERLAALETAVTFLTKKIL